MEIKINNGELSATIRDLGAELISLTNGGKEYMWEGDPAFWGKHSPVLFPIVGTLKNNTYRHNGKDYSLPRHGFARERNFELVSREEHKAVFSLKVVNVTYEVYPFNFELIIGYELTAKSLVINYEVKNLADATMPFSLGAHPAFALPGNFDDYSLHFPEDKELTRYKLENDLVSDKTEEIELNNGNLPLSYNFFKDDALVMKELASQEISIMHNGSPYLTVAWQNFPHLGLWTKVGAPFICIEPWQGYADTPANNGNLSEKEGVINLAESGNRQFSISIAIPK
ncbi:MAG: aldose 1-epimerase family protein [Flavobacterium sp.]